MLFRSFQDQGSFYIKMFLPSGICIPSKRNSEMQASMQGALSASGLSEELEQNLLSLLRASPTQKNVKKKIKTSIPAVGVAAQMSSYALHHLQQSSSQEHWQSHTSLYLILASLYSVNSVFFFHLSLKQRFGKQERKPKPN